MSRRKDGFVEACTRCGKPVYRPPCKRRGRPFCSRACHMKTLNEELNPSRMTPEVRQKLRNARLGTGEGKTYEKTFGVHTHRLVAELMLGRPLNPEEVVHHKDGNKRNNSPENLEILENQAEHARLHMLKRGGDAE